MFKIRETLCKTILNKSSLADFTLNCYVGCSHRCLYCYARYMTKFKERPQEWGGFVDVKTNAPQALARQIRKIQQGRDKEVFMSSVCDGWQPVEAKYRLSRACLKLLLEAGFKIDILTKSALILRDFDLLGAYKTPRLGLTITAADLKLQKLLEPYASNTTERMNTLKKALGKGIKTWVFMGPLIPEISDTQANLEAIFRALQGLDLDEILVDRLNPRWGVLESLKRGLSRGEYISFRMLLYKCTNPQKYAEYFRQLKDKTQHYACIAGLSDKVRFCF
jgi:DNA repair photolyase